MAADLDMEAAGGEGWGDDAELNMDEGSFRPKPAMFPQSFHFNPKNILKL